MKRLTLALACALALAACSTGGSSSSSGSSTGSSGTTSATSSGSTGTTGTGSTSGSTGSSGSSGSTGADGGLYVIPGMAANVDVTVDTHDVAHIHCVGLADCLRVQGYIHAQDRFFEMDLVRRLAEGRLSELLGSSTVDTDKTFRTLFITRDGQRIEHALAQALDANTKSLLQAYADGVNAFLAEARAGRVLVSGEYTDILVPANSLQDWTIEDTLAVGRLQQWELSETLGQETNYTQMVVAATGMQEPQVLQALLHSRQLYPAYTIHPAPVPAGPHGKQTRMRAGARAINVVQPALNQLADKLSTLRHGFGKFGFSGSNDWVVDAAHSATGQAMVANDPHLTLQYPPLFHMSHLIADTEGVNLLGNTFPGVPGALTGRGAHVGWGVTVVGYDVTDLYQETFTDATHVMFNGQPVQIQSYTEDIIVRNASGGAPTTQQVTIAVVPHHGPLISVDQAHGTGISVRWTGHEVTREFKALVGLWQAADVNAAFTALADWGTGAQNFVLADDQGHIGYDPHALVPARPWAGQTVNNRQLIPYLVLPGTGEAEWGYGDGGLWIPDDQLPQAKDPSWGYLATANSDPIGYTDDDNVFNDPNYLSFAFDDQSGIRIGRITEMLDGFIADGGTVSEADMEQIQTDHAVILGRYFTPVVDSAWAAANVSDPDGGYASAVALFDTWNGDGYACPTGLTSFDPASAPDTDPVHSRDSAACAYFHTFLRTLVADVFADDEAAYSTALGTSFQFDDQLDLKGFFWMMDPANNNQKLCDDRSTASVVETCNDMVVKALKESRDLLAANYGPDPMNWRWGTMHTVTFETPLGSSAPDFNAGPFARPGGYFSVDVGPASPIEVPANDPNALAFHIPAGPNERFIAVMDGSITRMQLPGYQHDVAYNGAASGLLADWLNDVYFEMPRSPTEISAAQASSVTFKAQ